MYYSDVSSVRRHQKNYRFDSENQGTYIGLNVEVLIVYTLLICKQLPLMN